MEEPRSAISPALPEPLVSAEMNPGPEMERILLAEPMEMSPTLPPPTEVRSVEALMRESAEKVIARSRGVLVLRLMEPA